MSYADETLRAFLAQELPAATARKIEADLAEDQELERRLMALDPVAAPIGEAFAGLPGSDRLATLEAALAAARPGVPSPARARAPLWLASGAAAGIAAGLALGLFLSGQSAPVETARDTSAWHQSVAEYQALYVPETVAHVAPDRVQLGQELSRAGAAAALALPFETLQTVAGLTLRRVQVLGYGSRPLIQLVYTDTVGQPYALCILRGGTAPEGPAMLLAQSSELWSLAEHQVLLIGRTDSRRLGALANAFQSVLGL